MRATSSDGDLTGLVLSAARSFLSDSPDDLHATITSSLAAVAELAVADRCYLALLEDDGRHISISHEWCRQDFAPVAPGFGRRDLQAYPSWHAALTAGRTVTLTSLDDLPDGAEAETGLLRQFGIEAVVGVPIAIDGRLACVLTLGWSRPRPEIAQRPVTLLQVLGCLFAATLRRQRDIQTLHQSEERADVAVRGTGVALWEWHVQTGTTVFDERWAEIIGYKLHELQPVSIETWMRFTHPDDLALSNERLQAHFRGDTDLYECEARMRHKNGDWVWVLDRGKVFEWDEAGKPLRMAGTHLDITDRKHAEQEQSRMRLELAQVQKMESVGRLAGGVAHDFNNLLTVIMGHAEMMQMDGGLAREHLENLELIIQAGARAQDLTKQLLAFSRKQVVRLRPIGLNAQIEQSLKMYRRLIGEDIALEFRPAATLPAITADPQQVDQVLGNLLVNARDALHAAGFPQRDRVISIDTKSLGIAREDEGFYGLPKGRYVLLTVSDNGIGMDAETRVNIFDPFFTTKRRDKGTGLGLATVFGIVNQNGGAIRVYSEPDKGTTFRILWPVADENPADVPETELPTAAAPGHETIMIVEDEDSVRGFAARALTRLGYTVLVAADGPTALAELGGMANPPDLLLTDVVMPQLTGAELAERAKARFPDLKVVFMSGYTDDIIARHGILEPGVELVEKPFTVAELSRRLRAVLDRG